MIYLKTFTAGIIYSLSYPNIFSHSPIAPIFAPLALFLLFREVKLVNQSLDLKALLFFTIAISLSGFYWIPQTLQTFGDIPIYFGIPLYLLFSPLILPQTWIGYFLFKFIKNKKPNLIQPLFISLCLAFIEVITPTQFPVHVGQGWMQWPMALGLAPLGGLAVYSFLNYYIALSLSFKCKKNIALSFIYLTLAFILTPFTLQVKTLQKDSQDLSIRFVQANVGNFMKIQSELGQFSSMREVYSRYRENSLENAKDIDLIIWPETAFPEDFNSSNLKKNRFEFSSYLHSILTNTKSHLLLGSYDVGQLEKSANSFQTVYNAATLLSPESGFVDVYHKKSLIPFGETIPLGPFSKLVKDLVPAISSFSKGSLDTVFKIKNYQFISPICYEILQPGLMRSLLNSSSSPIDFIVNLTNDSWYGKTAEPYQHLYLSKWRAVEFQRPILRSTNSGITSIIDIDGTESKRLNLGEVGYLDLKLNLPKRSITPYQKYGVLTLFLFFFIALIIDKSIQFLFATVLKTRNN